MAKLGEYEPVVGKSVVEELFLLAGHLKGRVMQHVNSTAVGGGVAEILNRLIPLFRDLGVEARWDVIKGDEEFFVITKKFHNMLHGRMEKLTKEDIEYFEEVGDFNLKEINFSGDFIFIHDPQPVTLIKKKAEVGRKWVWRCHIDSASAESSLWNYLAGYIKDYDAAIFSTMAFSKDLPCRQVIISPSIDPVSDKNKYLDQEFINRVLERFQIDKDRPIITQISRFDYQKDPLGVIKVYRLVKKRVDCQLVLAGGGATDDPEGQKILEMVREESKDDPDIHVLLLPPASDKDINALQRASNVILQKSLREGFGLTVAEALWKEKPVVASAVGGIPLQVVHNYTGLLSHTVEGTAGFVKQLLQNPEHAKKLGTNGREHIRQNFLVTRHIRDYLLLMLSLEKEGDFIYL
ncbi:MAG TPA: glycosyltransferase [Candidatus Hypogeohydataceae bacterium YC41]